MYQDYSCNPIDAMQGVDMLLGGLQAGLSSLVPARSDDQAVSLAHYQELQAEYRELCQAADECVEELRRRVDAATRLAQEWRRQLREAQLRSARQGLEIARLKNVLTKLERSPGAEQ